MRTALKYVYVVLFMLSAISAVQAVWSDNWAKASFFAIVTLVWAFMLERDYPIKTTGK